MDKLVLNTANILKKDPKEIEAISLVYDTVSRFAGFSIKKVDEAIEEISGLENGKRVNDYKELPVALTSKVKQLIKNYGNVNRFFSPYKKERNFLKFCESFYKERLQPRDFYFQGVITFRHLKWNVRNDTTYQTEYYSQKAA